MKSEQWPARNPAWQVAWVEAAAPTTGSMVRIIEVYDPPILEYVDAWRAAGRWRLANPDRIFIVIEAKS